MKLTNLFGRSAAIASMISSISKLQVRALEIQQSNEVIVEGAGLSADGRDVQLQPFMMRRDRGLSGCTFTRGTGKYRERGGEYYMEHKCIQVAPFQPICSS